MAALGVVPAQKKLLFETGDIRECPNGDPAKCLVDGWTGTEKQEGVLALNKWVAPQGREVAWAGGGGERKRVGWGGVQATHKCIARKGARRAEASSPKRKRGWAAKGAIRGNLYWRQAFVCVWAGGGCMVCRRQRYCHACR